MKKILLLIILIATVVLGCNIGEKTLSKEKISQSGDVLMLVNKSNPIKSTYNEEDLVTPNIRFLKTSTSEEKLMRKEAAVAIETLFEMAKRDNIVLYGNSGYRSERTQRGIYNHIKKTKGKSHADSYVAKPGESEHETGLAMDVTNKERSFTENCKESKWLENNAYKYGFIIRYKKGKEDITGYDYEPWHIRYVGIEAAKKIYKKGITLEEYLDREWKNG